MILSKQNLIFLYITFIILLLGVSYVIIHSQLFISKPNILAFGITFDITLTIPLTYYIICRKWKLPKLILIPIFLFSLIIAAAILPKDQHHFIQSLTKALAPIEILFFVFITYKAVRTLKEYKKLKTKKIYGFTSIIKESLEKTIGPGMIANILATEISLFYFGILAWITKKPTRAKIFTTHRKIGLGGIVGVLTFLSVQETFVVHLLLMQLSNIAAWIVTILNLYGIIFILADFNATRKQPVIIENKNLYLNIGIRWRTIIPLKYIESIETPGKYHSKEKHILKALTLFGSPNLFITLKKMHVADGFYGIQKKYNKIALNLDNPQALKEFISKKFLNQD